MRTWCASYHLCESGVYVANSDMHFDGDSYEPNSCAILGEQEVDKLPIMWLVSEASCSLSGP